MPSCIRMTRIPQKQDLAIQQRPYGPQGPNIYYLAFEEILSLVI